MIWFTSDHHFYHRNIITHCQRPFADIDEMHSTLIDRWNDRVSKTDTVYYLGDFGMYSGGDYESIFLQLNGKKFLVAGNHEVKKVERLPWAGYYKYHELKYNHYFFVLFHYPIEDWNKKHHGSIHLHGHSHGKSRIVTHRFDVGVDCHDFYPISIDHFLGILS